MFCSSGEHFQGFPRLGRKKIKDLHILILFKAQHFMSWIKLPRLKELFYIFDVGFHEFFLFIISALPAVDHFEEAHISASTDTDQWIEAASNRFGWLCCIWNIFSPFCQSKCKANKDIHIRSLQIFKASGLLGQKISIKLDRTVIVDLLNQIYYFMTVLTQRWSSLNSGLGCRSLH